MRNKKWFLLLGSLLLAGSAKAQVLSLGDALRLAEKTSPDLQAQLERETQARAETGTLSAYYFPRLDLAGVDSTGFPGSGSPTPAGFGGIINSPYRSGLAGDVDGTWTLFDASQGYGLTASRYREMSTREETRVIRLEVDQTALKLYFDACRYKGLEKVWQGVVDRIKPIQETVKHFVRTGRYNEVQMLLLQDQMDQAQLNVDTYEQRYRTTLKRLGLALGWIVVPSLCPIPRPWTRLAWGSSRKPPPTPTWISPRTRSKPQKHSLPEPPPNDCPGCT